MLNDINLYNIVLASTSFITFIDILFPYRLFIVSCHCSDVFHCKLIFVLDLPVSSEELMLEVETWGLDAESGWGWRIQTSQTYLLAWITFLSWVAVLGFLRALMWVLAITSSGKAPILVDINDRPFKTLPQWGIWGMKMPITEFLERFNIFSGFFVFVVRVGTWCPQLNLCYYDSSIPASVELHSPSFGKFISKSGDLQWAILGRDQVVHVAISPFRWVEGSHSFIVLRTLMLESWNGLSHSLHRPDFGEGGIWVESRTRLFHSLPILNDHPRKFGSFTFAIAQSAYITHSENFARSQPLLAIPWNLSYLWGILTLHWS